MNENELEYDVTLSKISPPPNTIRFVDGDNEVWIELDFDKQTIELHGVEPEHAWGFISGVLGKMMLRGWM